MQDYGSKKNKIPRQVVRPVTFSDRYKQKKTSILQIEIRFNIFPSTVGRVLEKKTKMCLCICATSKVKKYIGFETLENQLLNQELILQPITNVGSKALGTILISQEPKKIRRSIRKIFELT
jgi:hypothetical protein